MRGGYVNEKSKTVWHFHRTYAATHSCTYPVCALNLCVLILLLTLLVYLSSQFYPPLFLSLNVRGTVCVSVYISVES